MSGHFLDIARWPRREHFELFRDASQPFFSVTAEVDVTALRERCAGRGGPPFFLSALYAALSAANQTEAFRRRLRGRRVWVNDIVHITSTIIREDDTFGFARFRMSDSLTEFLERGREEIARVKQVAPIDLPDADDALIYHSTIPWVRFTAFSNAIVKAGDSIPRVVFGRCSRDGSSWKMPVAVEVHHAVVDGIDVGRFFERLQEAVEL
ncbi:MAG TPA: CatA-like O-acetyltransferase [Gemmatimonadaceae bacterium]|nr:CatA-like O-acetyltransferase [Gemmatimonadaceae bacterium]